MAKDASMFFSLDTAAKKKIYVANDFSLDISGHGDVSYRCGWIVDVFHVLIFSVNMFSVSQLTQTSKIVDSLLRF